VAAAAPNTSPKTWMMPVAWCAATTSIIASGLAVPMAGGPGAAGFGYVFEVVGYGADFRLGLTLYALAAAALGAAFMFAPKITNWRFSSGLAWTTLLFVAIGGLLMLVVPQVLLALAEPDGARATSLAQAWSIAWLEAGSRISVAGVLVAVATFIDAYLRRRRA